MKRVIIYFLSILLVDLGIGFWNYRRKIRNLKVGLITDLLFEVYEHYMLKKGFWIAKEANFVDQPLFPHGLAGIFISRDAVIGSNCTIFHHVTIGSNNLIDSRVGAPLIGNNVYIGAGAKIIGPVTIADNCRIGSNCSVYKDMPPNSVAVSAPTRIINKENLDNHFYTKRLSPNGVLSWYYFHNGGWILGKQVGENSRENPDSRTMN